MKNCSLVIILGIILIFPLLTACEKADEINSSSTKAEFLSFKIETKNNPLFIQEDISFLIKDETIQGRVPYYSNLSNLIASFEYEGNAVYVNDTKQISGVTSNDFTKDVIYKIVAEDGTIKWYNISLKNFTGLPVINIQTKGVSSDNINKETWVEADMLINGAGIFADYSDKIYIKGRGNSTWNAPKKPYALKLNKKSEILEYA